MEQLVAAALFNAVLLHALHLSLFGGWRIWLLGAALPAALTLLAYPVMVGQGLLELRLLLQRSEPVLSLAALLTAEALVGIAGARSLLRRRYAATLARWESVLGFLPGVSVVLSALAAQALAFHHVSGRDFGAVAAAVALGVFAAVAVPTLLLRWLVPEWLLRIEIRLLLLAGQLGVAVALAATVTALPATSEVAPLEWPALLAVCAGAGLLALGGFLRARRRFAPARDGGHDARPAAPAARHIVSDSQVLPWNS